ncbi:MAG: HD domain-containing protein [Treponema sp.]|jgi:putative nucleotidyltransferase with HDIG domain|nr:HD domain-containing protein [Treponema sp.]
MGKLLIHPLLQEIAGIFTRRGKQVFLVGGAVRDLLRGRQAQDWDLATDALPQEVMALFPRVIPTGIKHGTVTVHFKGRYLEVTTYRTESGYHDGRRPDQVTYASRIEEDLSRRDFTMNAIALPLPTGPLVDPFNGIADIRARRIRCVGNPQERFAEDGLRPVRALRFASQMGFEVEKATLEAIPQALKTTEKVSPERIRDELDKILASPQPSRAFLLMEKTGLLELLLPELAACRNIEQKGFHRFDVLDHSLLACDAAAREKAPGLVRAAALLHDIGKPLSRSLDAHGVWTFYQHEQVSARLSRDLLIRFRYPNAVIDGIVHLIREHMFHYEENWSDGAVRRFIIRVGEEKLNNLYLLRRADAYATSAQELPRDFLLPLITRVDAVLAKSRALSLRDLPVSGKDLLGIGIKPGPPMGRILSALLEAVVEDPALNTRETLLTIAGNLKERYG